MRVFTKKCQLCNRIRKLRRLCCRRRKHSTRIIQVYELPNTQRRLPQRLSTFSSSAVPRHRRKSSSEGSGDGSSSEGSDGGDDDDEEEEVDGCELEEEMDNN